MRRAARAKPANVHACKTGTEQAADLLSPRRTACANGGAISINLVVRADVLEDRAIIGGELKDHPDIVFDREAPEVVQVAG